MKNKPFNLLIIFFILFTNHLISQVTITYEKNGGTKKITRAGVSKTLFVNKEAPQGSGNSWNDSYLTLTQAMNVACKCSLVKEIWIANGVYYTNSNNYKDSSFLIPSGVKLYGGFKGIESSILERDSGISGSIISGDIGVVNDSLDNSHTLFKAIDTQSGTLLDGFVINGSYGTHSNEGSALKIISENDSTFLKLKNVHFENNVADRGAAISTEFGQDGYINLDIDSCSFINNKAHDLFARGGAINLDLDSCTFELNVKNTVFQNNSAESSGAIYLGAEGFESRINYQFINSIFKNNTSQGVAGLLYEQNTGDLFGRFEGCLFYGNYTMEQDSIGMQLRGKDSIINCTFYKDRMSFRYGEFYMTNNIFWGRDSFFVNNFPIDGVTKIDFTNSIIQDSFSFEKYPVFNSSTSAYSNIFIGGPSFRDPLNFDFSIGSCSEAVDHGVQVKLQYHDIVGTRRPINGLYDLGAFEYDGPNCCRPVLEANYMPLLDDTYRAGTTINSGGSVSSSGMVHFRAGQEVNLSPGFMTDLGGVFTVDIEDCISN